MGREVFILPKGNRFLAWEAQFCRMSAALQKARLQDHGKSPIHIEQKRVTQAPGTQSNSAPRPRSRIPVVSRETVSNPSTHPPKRGPLLMPVGTVGPKKEIP